MSGRMTVWSAPNLVSFITYVTQWRVFDYLSNRVINRGTCSVVFILSAMLYRFIFLALFLGIASGLPQNFLRRAKPSQRGASSSEHRLGVYDGKSTSIANHPYLAAIVLEGEFYCAAAILSESWVITDADCIYWYTKSEVKVVTGSNDGTTGTSYSVKKMVEHPDYDKDSYSYDFALVEIKETFSWGDKVANVSLPSANPSVNTAFVVAGYGDTSEVQNTGDSTLRQGTLKWQSNSTCETYYEDLFGWDESQACAYNKGKTTLCDGDWGDPFVKDGVLYGLFVGGLSTYFCSEEAWPVVVANVYTVVDWIQEYTGATVAY